MKTPAEFGGYFFGEAAMSEFGDFNFQDFDAMISDPKFNSVDVCGLVKKIKSKRRKFFDFRGERNQVLHLVGEPPKSDECFKMISGGGFSSLGIVKFVAEREPIASLFASTFRIGWRHFFELCRLHERGLLANAKFLTSESQRRMDEKFKCCGRTYNYFEFVAEKCRKFGWRLSCFDNHSKIILMRTAANFYVVETSSNLNENPKMEHFSWENDEGLFRWYSEFFDELTGESNFAAANFTM